MASGAVALAVENLHPAFLLRRQRTLITIHVAIERSLLGNQRRLVQQDGHTEVEREVQFKVIPFTGDGGRVRSVAMSLTVDRNPARMVPEFRTERSPDQLPIAHGKPSGADLLVASERQRSQHAVRRIHPLLHHRHCIQKAPSDLRPGTSGMGHFHAAQHGTDRLGSQAGVGQPDPAQTQLVTGIIPIGRSLPVAGAPRRPTVEDLVRPTIPEVADVEDRVDDRRTMPPGRLPLRSMSSHRHDPVSLTRHGSHAGRSADVVRSDQSRQQVDPCILAGCENSIHASMESTLHPTVGTCVVMTGGAGRPAVTAHLHVPEKSLPQLHRRTPVLHQRQEVSHDRYRHRSQ